MLTASNTALEPEPGELASALAHQLRRLSAEIDHRGGRPRARAGVDHRLDALVVVLPDGRRVVTSSQDETVKVWDAETGQSLTEPMKHDNGVVSAQFSPDGKRIATASYDRTTRVWMRRLAKR